MKPSLVPAVLDALFVMGQAAAATVESCVALDGPGRGDDLPRRYVVTGWSGQPNTRGVEFEDTDQGAAQSGEKFDVQGAVSMSSGDDGQKTVRDQAFAVLNELAEQVRKLPSAQGGVRGVARARLSKGGVEPFTGDGAGCTVQFTIHIEGNR